MNTNRIILDEQQRQCFQVHTVAPSIVLGELMVKADKRDSKSKQWAEELRVRRVVIPAGYWGEFSVALAGQHSQGLTDILRESLLSLAAERLDETLGESRMARMVPAADYTIASLLAWSEETASSRGSLTFTKEQVVEWFAASKTQQDAVTRWTAAGKTAEQQRVLMDFLSKRFYALAAKNHGLKDAADADKLLAMVNGEDAATGLGADIVGRISHISKQLAAKKDEANMSMDQL